MRQWHRRLSIFVAIFMVVIAASGVALQIEMMRAGPQRPMPGSAARYADADYQRFFATILAGARRQTHGDILGIDLRTNAYSVYGEVVVAEPGMRRFRIDARTGTVVEPDAPGPRDLHGFLLNLHRGAIAGMAGLWLSMACGAILIILSVTGIGMYLQMHARRRTGRFGFFR